MNMRKFIKTRVTRNQYEQGVELMLTPVDVDVRHLYMGENINFAQWNELQHLIWICGAEARGEQKDGIEYVAHTIINRQQALVGYFGLSIREVIHKCGKNGVYQFSAADPEDPNFNWLEKEPKSVFYKVAKAVIPVYTKQIDSPNKHMLYYHATSIETPKFFKDKLIHYATLGAHKFFLDPNINMS